MSTPNNNSDTETADQPSRPDIVRPEFTVEGTHADRPPIPDSVKPRPYIEIRPSETPLDARTVVRAMDLLYSMLDRETKTGLRHFLTRSTQAPLVEWCLISDGREDTTIRYLVGTSQPDLLSELENILRTCVPNTYELTHVEWHPQHVEEHLPLKIIGTQPTDPSEQTGQHHPAISPSSPYIAGVEYKGRAERRFDWQTPLTPFGEFTASKTTKSKDTSYQSTNNESRRIPLASLIETIRDATVPVIYQAVCAPGGDWTPAADDYLYHLERGQGSLSARFWEMIYPEPEESRRTYKPTGTDKTRIDGIQERTLRRTFCVSARAVALTRETPEDADRVARRLTSAFAHVSGENHEIRGEVRTDDELHPGSKKPPGSQIFDDLCERTVGAVTYETQRNYLPWIPHESTGVIVAPEELPGFCLLGGGGLTPNGQRALATRPVERTGIPLPPPQQLLRYQPPGMTLCMPLTHDRQPYGQPLAIKPVHQSRHLLLVGDTGAGKTVLLCGAILTNVIATNGPEIIFDTKGGGTAEEFLRAYYATFGNLDDVMYFDFTEILPALTFFDIESLLAAGIPREEARSRKAGHYEEILKGVMGAERFGRAVDSPKAIRNHIKALFDPIHGQNAFSHTDLYEALRRTQEQQTTPPVSDNRYTEYFENLVTRDRDVFKKVLSGAIGRVDEIATNGRLAPLFEFVATDDQENGRSPRFDFADEINEDTVIIFDFGGMEDHVKRTLTLVLLSNLWSALKARKEDSNTPESAPLVNVYLEEAAGVADTTLVDTLLSQGRSFDVSLTLGVQFARQLDSPDPSDETYLEALNETATFVVGNVSVRDDLTEALATGEMPPQEVARRLSALRSGKWLVRPGSGFDEPTPQPFLAESLPAPRGHPASDDPLAGTDEMLFQAAFEKAKSRTYLDAGIARVQQTGTKSGETETETEASAEDTDGDETSGETIERPSARVDTLLAHTKRLPKFIRYDEQSHALRCGRCQNRYDPSIKGMCRAIECCHSMDDVNRDNIPICEFNLKLSPTEIAESDWSISQLLFVQAVYNAQQLRYDPLEYDIIEDSMLCLQEYVGIEPEEIQGLIDADVLRRDGDHPHRLYSVTPEGRPVIGEAYREGVDYGHGVGDLEESAQHVCLNEAARRYLIQEYEENPESDVIEVHPYYELDNGHRLDCAGLDSEGNVVVTVEAERINNDRSEAILDDFDKMASCDPQEAIWFVLTRQDAHDVLETLYEPRRGTPRVEKTYSRNTPPQQFRLNAPGVTAIYPITYIQRELDDTIPIRSL
ncbi:ATP-binding protein [Haladaptatus halobius]|uniref:ATP-binding protein n=1 Tax=Haladaptatus halobius TaxID=2884875 RepID=UPI001D09F034|nr:ATP-binding protein [Haladaptatus halobius]